MVRVLQICRNFQGWTIEYVLDLPFLALESIVKNTERIVNLERVEQVRIALVAQADSKYSTELLKHYAEGVKTEKEKPVPVSTVEAFAKLRKLIHG